MTAFASAPIGNLQFYGKQDYCAAQGWAPLVFVGWDFGQTAIFILVKSLWSSAGSAVC